MFELVTNIASLRDLPLAQVIEKCRRHGILVAIFRIDDFREMPSGMQQQKSHQKAIC